MVANGQADDRDLLMSRGARPNVLMVVDSSGSMAQDVATDTVDYVASMDDPHSKMYQVKYAVKQFVNAYPQFNMGFSFFERSSVEFGDQLFLYRLSPDGPNIDFSWRYRILGNSINNYGSQVRMQLKAGDPIRLGDYTPTSSRDGSYQDAGQWGPLFGASGTHVFSDWSAGITSSPLVYFNGEKRGKYRVDAKLLEPTAGTGYYYPSYTWSEDLNAVPSAINVFTAVHDQYAPQLFDPLVSPELKIEALQQLRTARVALQEVLNAHQIGSPTLTMRVTLSQCTGTGTVTTTTGKCSNSGGWTLQQTIDVPLVSAQGLAAGAFASGDTTIGTYPGDFMVNEYELKSTGTKSNYFYTSGTYTPRTGDRMYPLGAQDFYTNNDCNGWLGATPDEVKIPLVPIPTDDDPPLLSLIDLVLGPTTQMRLYFPTRTDGLKSWPKFWDPKSPCQFDSQAGCAYDMRGAWVTDRSMYATGSTPLGNSINDSYQYFSQDVLTREDEFKSCRKNFVILLTDGLETCKSDPCSAATNIWKNTKPYNVSVFVIGYGVPDQRGNDLKCIAENSHGELYLPNNIEELIEALERIGQQIVERSRGFAAPTVPSVELSTREKGYISTFVPRTGRSIWEGHLRAYLVDIETGMIPLSCSTSDSGVVICDPDTTQALWDAGEVMRERTTSQRNLYFGTGGTSVPGARYDFAFSAATSTMLRNRIGLTLTDTELQSVISFMRGDRDAAVYENPPWKMGDIFHSVPYLAGAPDCYSCFLQDAFGYQADFYTPNVKRRKVLYVGADDGFFHAFEAGMFNRDVADWPEAYDGGTGKELFGWAPNAVMSRFKTLATGEFHHYTVDGTPTIVDVYIDPSHSGTPDVTAGREWRTIAIFGERNGGDSFVALDVTKPDTYDSNGEAISGSDDMPGCLNGGTGCAGNYPALLWEFSDRVDEDGNGYPDMRQTWSRPVVGWIKVRVEGASADSAPETRNVAIVGGGYDGSLVGGNFLYMIDIETGRLLLKAPVAGSVPCEVAALDFNFDGYIERLYWGDVMGSLWRLDTSNVATVSATTGRIVYAVGEWQAPYKLLSVGTEQRFFQRPLIVLSGFTLSGAPMFSVGLGSGDREEIFTRDPTVINRFYMVSDRDDGATLTESNLQRFETASAAVTTGTNYLLDSTLRGWYLVLDAYEKVNTAAIAVENTAVFSTFTPSDQISIEPDPENPGQFLCREAGNARTYLVDTTNANPYPGETARYLQLDESIAMVSEPIVYVGEDGKLHVLQATDNLAMVQPMAPRAVGATVVSWRER